MISFDLLLTFGSMILTITMLPMLINKKTQVPWWSSLPTAIVLFPYFGIIFWLLGTPIMSVTVSIEGVFWYYVFARRRVKKTVVETQLMNGPPDERLFQ